MRVITPASRDLIVAALADVDENIRRVLASGDASTTAGREHHLRRALDRLADARRELTAS